MYKNVKLEKGLYSIAGKTFTQALAQLDPDENYAGTELSGLDAFERQLKRFDIKISGADSDKVEKFFTTTESAVLFPEYVRRTIQQGLDEASILPDIVAARSYTEGIDFRAMSVKKAGTDTGVAQGAEVPATTVTLASAAKALTKFARKLSFSYESIRNQRLETLGVILKGLGAAISESVNAKAISESATGVTASKVAAASTVTYADITKFWASMKNFNMTTMICSPEVMAKILALSEMKYCISDYMTSGRVKTPYGVTIIKSSSISDGKIYAFDNSCAVEMVQSGDVTVDFDKLLSTQCSEVSCSVLTGFARINDGAVAVLDTDSAE